jgi:hypothetical protein
LVDGEGGGSACVGPGAAVEHDSGAEAGYHRFSPQLCSHCICLLFATAGAKCWSSVGASESSCGKPAAAGGQGLRAVPVARPAPAADAGQVTSRAGAASLRPSLPGLVRAVTTAGLARAGPGRDNGARADIKSTLEAGDNKGPLSSAANVATAAPSPAGDAVGRRPVCMRQAPPNLSLRPVQRSRCM